MLVVVFIDLVVSFTLFILGLVCCRVVALLATVVALQVACCVYWLGCFDFDLFGLVVRT